MRPVAVIGVGMTKFGELWEKSFRQLVAEAGLEAVRDAGIPGEKIDAMYVGSMSAGRLIGQEHLGPLAVDEAGLAHTHMPSVRVEAADASGGAAFRQALLAVASGAHDVAVVGGAEKMTDVIDQEQINTLATAADQEWEAFFGATYPSLWAMMAQKHMHDYGTTREQLAMVAVKNHLHGSMNSKAAYGSVIDAKTVLGSPMVSDPLRLFDSASNVDGAAAVVIADLETAKRLNPHPVLIKGSGSATDTLALHDRHSLTELAATRIAAERAYKMAGLKPADMQFAEVHDCFTIAEVMAIEDLGFVKKGEGGKAVESGMTGLKGKLPVNPSGGLKARGHPPGATGIAQIAELVWQLRGTAGQRQVQGAKRGLAHNVGGSGASAYVHILEGL
ncbi:MAG: thiolase domain-containing protein [Halobacteriales archaeon]|nr:thiolase domain-containing protein [Halobacteriales archaeon]